MYNCSVMTDLLDHARKQWLTTDALLTDRMRSAQAETSNIDRDKGKGIMPR